MKCKKTTLIIGICVISLLIMMLYVTASYFSSTKLNEKSTSNIITANKNQLCYPTIIVKETCSLECMEFSHNELEDTHPECIGGYATICRNSTFYNTECSIEIYGGDINYYNGSTYVKINTSLKKSDYSNYVYELSDAPYKVYFRNNSNTAEAVRFEKDGYYFIYDISGSNLQWRGQLGFPARTDTLGGGDTSNSIDTKVSIDNNLAVYQDAFSFTNVTYQLFSNMLKETFVLSKLPNIKPYDYLEYTGNIKFNKSLTICANDVCYIPSGKQDDFETSGKIEFKDINNKTIFYLKEPIITDSNGSSTLGLYSVHGSDAQMNFWLRINRTFLEKAVFPIEIDPTIQFKDSSTDIMGDTYIYQANLDTNYGSLTDIVIHNSANDRIGYVMFNISDMYTIPYNLIANSEICMYNSYYSSGGVSAYYVDNETWSEDVITWNNQPVIGEQLGSEVSGSQLAYWCWDVTTAVTNNLTNNADNISFAFKQTTGGTQIQFYSKEFGSIPSPYLNITYSAASLNITNCSVLSDIGTIYYLKNDIIDSSTSNCMDITADNIILDCEGHTIDGNHGATAGIRAENVNNITIHNCTITNWKSYGIDTYRMDNSTIKNSNISYNSGEAIEFQTSNYNFLNNLNIDNNGNSTVSSVGVRFLWSTGNNIYNSTIINHKYYDVQFANNANLSIYCDNQVTNVNGTGNKPIYWFNNTVNLQSYNNASFIGICNASNSVINSLSFIDDNSNMRLSARLSDNVNVTNTTMKTSYYGIDFRNSSGNFIFNNNITSLWDSIISFENFKNNKIYNNYFKVNSTEDYFVFESYTSITNTAFNTSRQSGTRIFSNGSLIGGNFYTNYNSMGYSDICTDADYNGFCDSAFNLTSNTTTTKKGFDVDYLPMSINGDSLIPYYLSFSNNNSNGYYGIAVKFSVLLYDDKQLSKYKFAHNSTGTLTNGTAQSISGVYYAANQSLTITLTKNHTICGQFWFNDTVGNENLTNSSCFTVGNSPPSLKTNLVFINYSVGHSFNVSVVFSDNDNSSDFYNHTIETSSGKCQYLLNTTIANDFTVKYNCSGTALQNTSIRINASDLSNIKISSSVISNTYPNQLPNIVNISINSTTPVDSADLLCLNGTTSDVDGENVILLYDWFKNGAAQNINVSNLSNTLTSVGENWQCKVTPFDGYQNGSFLISASVSIGTTNVAPVIVTVNATTSTTGINSTSTKPTNNDSWYNMSVQFTDANTEKWTAYFCRTNNANAGGCIDASFCNSSINSTNTVLSCRFNASTLTTNYSTLYAFVVDNNSLISSSKSYTFYTNFYPTKSIIVTPLNNTNQTLNWTLVNYSSYDANNDLINYTIYNSTDSITWSVLYDGNLSYYNWTNMSDGIYYLKSSTKDYYGYSINENSSITQFKVDTTPPAVNLLWVSSSAVYTTDTLYYYVNVTDVLSNIDSDSCIIGLYKSDIAVPNFNLTTNTKTNDILSKSLSMGLYGTGVLEWRYLWCTDSLTNTYTNVSVNINITISTEPTPPSGGGGALVVNTAECFDDEDCLVYGTGYYCVSDKCIKMDRKDIARTNLMKLGLPNEIVENLLVRGSGYCNWDGQCELIDGENSVNCKSEIFTIAGDNVLVEGDCGITDVDFNLTFIGGIAGFIVISIIALYIYRGYKRKKVRNSG